MRTSRYFRHGGVSLGRSLQRVGLRGVRARHYIKLPRPWILIASPAAVGGWSSCMGQVARPIHRDAAPCCLQFINLSKAYQLAVPCRSAIHVALPQASTVLPRPLPCTALAASERRCIFYVQCLHRTLHRCARTCPVATVALPMLMRALPASLPARIAPPVRAHHCSGFNARRTTWASATTRGAGRRAHVVACRSMAVMDTAGLVSSIHATATKLVLYVTGGGSKVRERLPTTWCHTCATLVHWGRPYSCSPCCSLLEGNVLCPVHAHCMATRLPALRPRQLFNDGVVHDTLCIGPGTRLPPTVQLSLIQEVPFHA